MPSFKDYALRAIKKHPEIFSALEEFERTKRIPKFSYRKRLDVTIDEHILKRFKEHCRSKGVNMSRVIEKHLKEELEHAKQRL
jgi:post-segregation antitoxin (ccd killing protein)